MDRLRITIGRWSCWDVWSAVSKKADLKKRSQADDARAVRGLTRHAAAPSDSVQCEWNNYNAVQFILPHYIIEIIWEVSVRHNFTNSARASPCALSLSLKMCKWLQITSRLHYKHAAQLTQELSFAQSRQCRMVTKVYKLHLFLILTDREEYFFLRGIHFLEWNSGPE